MDTGDRISSRKPKVDATGAAPDWSSLPSDLVGRVADVFLATNDVDYYMSLRAVCRVWRAAVDPRGPADEDRFRLRRWIMLDEAAPTRLFCNVDTGRHLERDLPVLCHYNCLGAADGLLLLRRASDRQVCMLNPFTGYAVRLPSVSV